MANNRVLRRVPPEDLFDPWFNRAERRSLCRLARSSDVADRRLCVEYLDSGCCVPRNRDFLLDIARLLIPDRSQRVRWQMLTMLTQFVELHPDRLWPLICEFGSVPSEDIRSGVACCLLEHVLEYQFAKYFACAKELIDAGNRRFALTLALCHILGEAEEPRNRQAFLAQDSGQQQVEEEPCLPPHQKLDSNLQ